MELDDLKQNWKKSTIKNNINTDIMELIQHKSYGPIAALKKEFRKQIILMLILPAFLLVTSVDDINLALTSILFWSYVFFCIGMAAFSWENYRMAARMEQMDGMVRSNLQQQVSLLEKRLQLKNLGLRVALLFFVILTEIVPYFQHYRMLDKWHSLSPLTRFGSYALLFIAQYFLGRKIMQRKFGNHINYLKRLLKDMD